MIIHPSQDDLETNLLNSLHHTEFLTYALVINDDLQILRTASNFSSFLGETESVNGRLLADVFVEFIGSQDNLRGIMQEGEGVFRLEYVAREVEDRTLRYYTIEVHPYKEAENALLLLLLDTTVAGRLQQLLTQERNELAFEVQRHEITQKLLKDSRDQLRRRANKRAKELERVNFALQEEIEERKRIQEELLQAQKMDAIGVLAGGIAHDFNNWLTVINSYSSQMMQLYADDNRIYKYSKQINEAGKQANLLTNQLLTFGRKQVSQPTVLDINQQVIEVCDLVQRLLGREISVQLDLSDALYPVEIDGTHFTQILINMILNARDAIVGEGVIKITSRNVVEDGRESVCLSVSDNGTGMTDEVQARIFEPFFTTKGTGKGTGLGLSTTYGIVKDMGGTITVKSEVGVGTTFCVHLPKAKGTVDSPVVSDSVERKERKAPADTTILVVDDVLEVLNLVHVCLSNEGYNMFATSNVHEAIELVHDEEIDLLVTDVVMPDMNGKQLAEQLQKTQPNEFGVLYISGFSKEILTQQDIDVENASLLMKPFTPETLVKSVKKLLS